ncbi:MAG TPA: ABC transporter permease [Stellaceae bacterium]|nr:ABC transporter permease [Stellaceae bacterium]
MEFFLEQLLNGLVYGMLLFLTAAGLSLIFGLMNVVSLTHGSFFMLGGYVGFSIYRLTGSFWLAFLLAPVPIGIVGVIMEMAFLRPLYRRGHLDQVLLTFGFTFIFFDAVQTLWGRDVLALPPPVSLNGVVALGTGVFSSYRLFLIGLGFVIALALWLFLERSRLGARVRAGVDDAAMAGGLGVNIPALFTAMFGAGVALAALGGVAAGPIFGMYPGEDAEILIPAFIVIVVGGMGSLRGAFIGSLLIGEADTFGNAYVPQLALFLIYLVMAVVLLARPQGLFGIKHAPAASPTGAAPDTPLQSRRALIAGLVVVAALIVYPLFVADYQRQLVTELFIFAIFAMSLDLLLGYTGLMSLGHAAFFGVGAYVVIVLGTLFGLDAWIGVAVGIVVAALAALVIGYFCVRTSGIPFLMLTLAFSQLIYSVALKWRDVTGGSDGIGIPQKPGFFGFDLSHALPMYFMALGFFVLCFLALRRLVASPLGRVFIGIRENEARMLAIGYATRRYKLASFTIGGAVAGFAGGLYAIFNGFISPDAVYWSASGDVLIMVMLGGAGTLLGPVFGAAAFLLMKNLVSTYSEHWLFIIGVIFVLCVMFFPGGIWGTLRRVPIAARAKAPA